MTTSKFLLEYLSRSETLYRIKCFFRELCRLHLNLLDANGRYLAIQHPEKTKAFPSFQKTCGISECRTSPQCRAQRSDCLVSAADRNRPQRFLCPMGYKSVLIPIMHREEPIAYLRAGEDREYKLNENQMDLVSSFLKSLIDRVIVDELKFLYNLKSDHLTRRQKLVNQVLEVIRENYNRNDLTLKEISTHNAVSYHLLSRIFKEELHTSFPKLRNKFRMEMARKLLKNRSLSVAQVSRMCGFDDSGYFCKVFKKTFGRSPLDFKRPIPH